MSNKDTNKITQETEVKSAKNIVDDKTVELEKNHKTVNYSNSQKQNIIKTGYIYFWKNHKIKKSHLFLVILFIVALSGVFVVYAVSKTNKSSSLNEELDGIITQTPTNYEQQKEWSKQISTQLESDDRYKNGSKEEKTKYYNSLVSLYNSEQNDQKARNIYITAVKPQGILLDASLLYWLKDSFIFNEDSVNAKNVLDDLILIAEKSIKETENTQDKTDIQKGIDNLKTQKQAIQ